mmetsp:Transcript_23809/g.52075  ORF Transcript_23809/g.52075 Transcript_23809/m.52075 type:complete len:200 (-) Transcript_23809:13-612(-)
MRFKVAILAVLCLWIIGQVAYNQGTLGGHFPGERARLLRTGVPEDQDDATSALQVAASKNQPKAFYEAMAPFITTNEELVPRSANKNLVAAESMVTDSNNLKLPVCPLGPGANPNDHECCLPDNFKDKCEACMCITFAANMWCNKDQPPDGVNPSAACYYRKKALEGCTENCQCKSGNCEMGLRICAVDNGGFINATEW